MRLPYLLIAAAVGLGLSVLLYRTLVPQGIVGEFAGVSLRLELATTVDTRATGLGGRKSIPPNTGMLFVFPVAERYGFWMKDTQFPLDIFWLDHAGSVVHVAADVATSSYPGVFYPPTPAQYVLETPAGFARAHAVVLGTHLSLQEWPSVSE